MYRTTTTTTTNKAYISFIQLLYTLLCPLSVLVPCSLRSLISFTNRKDWFVHFIPGGLVVWLLYFCCRSLLQAWDCETFTLPCGDVTDVTGWCFWLFLHTMFLSSAALVFLGRTVRCLLVSTQMLSFFLWTFHLFVLTLSSICASKWAEANTSMCHWSNMKTVHTVKIYYCASNKDNLTHEIHYCIINHSFINQLHPSIFISPLIVF